MRCEVIGFIQTPLPPIAILMSCCGLGSMPEAVPLELRMRQVLDISCYNVGRTAIDDFEQGTTTSCDWVYDSKCTYCTSSYHIGNFDHQSSNDQLDLEHADELMMWSWAPIMSPPFIADALCCDQCHDSTNRESRFANHNCDQRGSHLITTGAPCPSEFMCDIQAACSTNLNGMSQGQQLS